jgi:hypothetical protein
VPLITDYIHHHPYIQLVQDCAPGHGAPSAIQELQRGGACMITWPLFSPDLYLIEMEWN